MMPVDEMNPKLANVWDLSKRAILGAALGAAAYAAFALFFPERSTDHAFENVPVLGPDGEWQPIKSYFKWRLPRHMSGSLLAVFAVCGAIIAVAGRNRFGRKTKTTIIGTLIGGVVVGFFCPRGGQFSHGGVQLAVVVGCLVGGVIGFVAAFVEWERES
jgi:hypothetical protein